MHLKLTSHDWSKTKLDIKFEQKDYEYIEKNNIAVFVYGYPLSVSKPNWITAGEIYQLYSKNGLDFIHCIEGVYSIVILDKVKGLCFVIVDRYDIYSLFYSRVDDYIFISDSISEITRATSTFELNERSIIEYLNFGFKIGNKTHIEGIYEFESARIYQIDSRLDIKENVYWCMYANSEKKEMSDDEFLEVYNAHIRKAIDLETRISLPLSGGLDTRTILSAIIPKTDRLHCHTYGQRNAPDVEIAKKICRYFDINHDFYELRERWVKRLPPILKKDTGIFNGLIPIAWFIHNKEVCERECNKGDLFLAGWLGNEIWRGYYGSEAARFTGIEEVSHALAKRYCTKQANLTKIYRHYSDKEMVG